MKDQIYTTPQDPLVKFTFDAHVADVFPDMIARSVPGYAATIAMIGVLAAKYAQPESRCYDLGSSLGAATLAMRHYINQPDVEIIAVDNSGAMVERSKKIIERDASHTRVDVRLQDIMDVEIYSASVVVLNFTLQFIQLEQRGKLIKKIYDGLLPGGVLILSEKIIFSATDEQQRQTNWHHNFKKANGYSDLEVAGKRNALENVLVPELLDTHKHRLLNAGFASVDLWFQCFNFVSLLAIK